MTPALIFDLDGTLVDTAPDLLAGLNCVLVGAGRRPVDLSDLRHLVGFGARAMMSEAFKLTGAAADPERIEGFMDNFIDHYRNHIADFEQALSRCGGDPGRFESTGRADGRAHQQAA